MSIQVQATPNPNARKFILPQAPIAQVLNFSSLTAAADHPLAARLFALPGVYNVFLAQDFVTVNKRPDVDWQPLTEQILVLLAEHLSQ